MTHTHTRRRPDNSAVRVAVVTAGRHCVRIRAHVRVRMVRMYVRLATEVGPHGNGRSHTTQKEFHGVFTADTPTRIKYIIFIERSQRRKLLCLNLIISFLF